MKNAQLAERRDRRRGVPFDMDPAGESVRYRRTMAQLSVVHPAGEQRCSGFVLIPANSADSATEAISQLPDLGPWQSRPVRPRVAAQKLRRGNTGGGHKESRNLPALKLPSHDDPAVGVHAVDLEYARLARSRPIFCLTPKREKGEFRS